MCVKLVKGPGFAAMYITCREVIWQKVATPYWFLTSSTLCMRCDTNIWYLLLPLQVGYGKDLDVFREDSPFNEAVSTMGMAVGKVVRDPFAAVCIIFMQYHPPKKQNYLNNAIVECLSWISISKNGIWESKLFISSKMLRNYK